MVLGRSCMEQATFFVLKDGKDQVANISPRIHPTNSPIDLISAKVLGEFVGGALTGDYTFDSRGCEAYDEIV